MPRLHRVRETHRLNVYDSIRLEDIAGDSGKAFLFGNCNVGNDRLTNLQIPGYLACDQTTILNHWYARTDVLPESLSLRQRAGLHRFAATTIVTLIVGDKPHWRWPLSDLLDQRPWEPASITESEVGQDAWLAASDRFDKLMGEGAIPLFVPVRQVVAVSMLTTKEPHDRLLADVDGIPITFWIHLEGISTRDHG